MRVSCFIPSVREKAALAAFMRRHGEEKGRGGLVRDAGNVSMAAELGLDNRIMYSIGLAALKTGLFGDPSIRCALGIPFSVSSKNVFFDRK